MIMTLYESYTVLSDGAEQLALLLLIQEVQSILISITYPD